MIIDSLKNWKCYCGIVPHYEEAMEFALDLARSAPGRYECTSLPEGKVYAMVQEGESRPFEEAQVEAHRKYLDVQIMLAGGETMYYSDIEGLKESVPYDEGKDIIFFEKSGQPLRILPDMFYLVFPQDGHMPICHLDGPGHYRKIVLKIRLEG